jgi:hypothetical protein
MTDISAEVTGWVADEIGKQRFGEDYGYAVMLAPSMLQTPQGPAQVPMWALLITARSPLLGQGPMYHGPVPLGVARPAEDEVRAQVTKGLKALRDLAASQLASANGHARQGLPR